MKFKDYFSKVSTLAYEGIFGLAVFAITYSTSNILYIWILKFLDLNIFTPKGEIRYELFDIVYFLIFGLVTGLIGSYFLNRKKWLRKISPYIILLFFPYSFIVGNFSHFTFETLNHSTQRLHILKSLHGRKIEPCDVLRIGDKIEQVHRFYGVPQMDGLNDIYKTMSGRMVDSKLFQLPFQSPLFTIHFNPKDETILEIECFNGKWKKARGALPDTVYEYIEESY